MDAQSFDIAEHVDVHRVPESGRRATTPPRLRDTPPPPIAQGAAAVGDVVPDRSARRACGVVHQDAPRHRRRRRRCGHARFVPRYRSRTLGDDRACVVAVPAALDAPTASGQSAATTPGVRPSLLSPAAAHRHCSATAALMAGGARDLRRGPRSSDQRQPQNRIGPPAGHHSRLARRGEERRPRPRRHRERRPDDGGRRRLHRAAAKPRRARRRCRPAGLRSGLTPPGTARRGPGQRRRGDADAAAHRATRRHATARDDRRGDGGAQEEEPTTRRQHVPIHASCNAPF